MDAIGDSRYPVFDEEDVEIQQESDLFVGEAQVGQELFFVDRGYGFYGFDFDDNFAVDDQVGIESGLDGHAVVDDGNRVLASEGQALFFEFAGER